MEGVLDGFARLANESPADQLKGLRKYIKASTNELGIQQFRKVYQCPTCGRLKLDSLDKQSGSSFVPENPETPHNLPSLAHFKE